MKLNENLTTLEIDALRRMVFAEQELRARTAALREAQKEWNKWAKWLTDAAFGDDSNLRDAALGSDGVVIEHDNDTWLVIIDTEGDNNHILKMMAGCVDVR